MRGRFGTPGAKLRQGPVEQEAWQHDAFGTVSADARRLAVERRGVRFEPREIGVSVGGVFDLVLAVEEVGDFDERAGVLRDDVRRVTVRQLIVERRHIAEAEAAALNR